MPGRAGACIDRLGCAFRGGPGTTPPPEPAPGPTRQADPTGGGAAPFNCAGGGEPRAHPLPRRQKKAARRERQRARQRKGASSGGRTRAIGLKAAPQAAGGPTARRPCERTQGAKTRRTAARSDHHAARGGTARATFWMPSREIPTIPLFVRSVSNMFSTKERAYQPPPFAKESSYTNGDQSPAYISDTYSTHACSAHSGVRSVSARSRPWARAWQ